MPARVLSPLLPSPLAGSCAVTLTPVQAKTTASPPCSKGRRASTTEGGSGRTMPWEEVLDAEREVSSRGTVAWRSAAPPPPPPRSADANARRRPRAHVGLWQRLEDDTASGREGKVFAEVSSDNVKENASSQVYTRACICG